MSESSQCIPHVGDCPFCASSSVISTAFDCEIPAGRTKKIVSGLQHSTCNECGETFASESQHNFNASLIEAAGREKQAFITQGLIRKFRERFSLTQRTASKLFGAGTSAVGKWESGQLPSGPAALLIQTAIHVPGAAQYLASLANVSLSESTDGIKWRSSKAPVTGAQRKYTFLLTIPKEKPSSTTSRDSEYTMDELYGVAA